MKKLILSISILVLLASCAHIEAPSGGEGDKTPPLIEQSSLKNAQLNFTDSEIELKFNKYMNRNSVFENLTISPKIKFTPKWSGKKLTIKFNEPLEDETTYSLQLSGKYRDYYNNLATDPFFLTFSTGNKIDTGKISGKIITENIKNKITIFAYNINDDEKDTINYFTEVPDYKTTAVATNGKFTIPALKDGKYRIIALEDLDNNGLISPKDNIGLPAYDPIITNAKSDFMNIIMGGSVNKNLIDSLEKDTTSAKLDSLAEEPIFMEVSGKIDNFEVIQKQDNMYILFYNKKNEYTVKIEEKGNYKFEQFLEGTYNIIVFNDKNKNGKFDKGSLIPFEFCETFYTTNQTLIVRKNWNITDFLIEIIPN